MKKLLLATLLYVLLSAQAPAARVQAAVPTLSLLLTPKSGPAGTKVNFVGTVLVTGASFILYWGEGEGEKLVEGKAERYEFSGSFFVPTAPYGNHDVLLYTPAPGTPGLYPIQKFKVIPTLALASSTAFPNSNAGLSGSGFPANESLELNFDGTLLKTAIADSKGGFKTDFSIPKCVAGSHILSAVSSKMASNDAPQVTITVTPMLTVSSLAPTIGSTVIINGDGYAANSKITIQYDDAFVLPEEKEVITDARGSFRATIIVPNGNKPKHTLTAIDDAGGAARGNVAAMVLGLEKDAPSPPMPISPINERFGIYGSQIVAFDWTDIKDPSGVTYTFEIGRNLNFFPPVLKEKDLQASEYVLTDNQALPQGTYFWRVKAVDGAGNDSGWRVAPQPFSVGLIPLWGFVVAGLVGLIIALLVLRAILRFIVQLFRFY